MLDNEKIPDGILCTGCPYLTGYVEFYPPCFCHRYSARLQADFAGSIYKCRMCQEENLNVND